MKKIHLLALAFSLLVLPSSLFGQDQRDGSSPTASARTCGPGKLVALDSAYAQFTPQKTGECICPPMFGAVQSGCGGHDEVGCGLKECQYKEFDVSSGEVTDQGVVSCIWQPYGFPQ